MTQEIELKLEIDPENLPLLREDPLFASAQTHSADEVTIYYDTRRRVLHKHGFTLRVRNTQGRFVQTIKTMTTSVGLISRDEIESEVLGGEPDLGSLCDHPLRKLLDAERATHLAPVICCNVTRTSADVQKGDAHIHIDLDHGTITAGGRTQEFAELELELVDGPPATLVIAARRLAEHVPVRLGVLTKSERGFRLEAGTLGKVTKAEDVRLHAGMSVAEAFEVIVHACLKHYRLNDPLVREERSAEALHQARVAMRRLRSALSLFKPAVEDVEFQYLRVELRWFTTQLGDARDLDISLERCLAEDERAKLVGKRNGAYDLVADAMNSERLRMLLVDLVGWTGIGAWRKGKTADRPLGKFAKRRLDHLWSSIAKRRGDIRQMDGRSRHKLRIRVKTMRYAGQFLHALYVDEHAQTRFASSLEALQDALGNLHDIAVAPLAGLEPRATTADLEQRSLKSAEQAYHHVLGLEPYWRLHGKAGVHG